MRGRQAPSRKHTTTARRLGGAFLAVVLGGFVVGITAIPAVAAPSCGLAGGTLTVTLAGGDSATFTLGAGVGERRGLQCDRRDGRWRG
jgi:hypothetical protein